LCGQEEVDFYAKDNDGRIALYYATGDTRDLLWGRIQRDIMDGVDLGQPFDWEGPTQLIQINALPLREFVSSKIEVEWRAYGDKYSSRFVSWNSSPVLTSVRDWDL
jgi:hypothetical protein